MFRFFSVDDHIVEPRGVWADRVPAKYRETAPHIIEKDGREFWIYEDVVQPQVGLAAVAGKPEDQWNSEPQRFSDMIPGCYDPVARAADFRSNGIFASVSFPSLPRFGGALFPGFKDKDLADVCVQAYNDFIIDEWCAAVPEMFVPMIICQLWDPELAAKEIARCIDKGARALTIPENTEPIGLPGFFSDTWDPLWRVCEEAGLPICMHIGSSGLASMELPQPEIVQLATAPLVHAINSSVNLMLSPVPQKFPDIKIVWSEGGIGWIPAALERAQDMFHRHRFWATGTEISPMEVHAKNYWYCMIEEPVGFKSRHDIGIHRILWESDYPHSATRWPHCQEGAAEVFKDATQEEIDLITHKNALELFEWQMPDNMQLDALTAH